MAAEGDTSVSSLITFAIALFGIIHLRLTFFTFYSRPKHSHYEILADKICALFPKERPNQWYVAPKTEGPHQKCKKGRLPHTVKNAKCKLVRKGALKGRSNKQNKIPDEDGNFSLKIKFYVKLCF